jgi:hypothetical protein
VEERRQGEQVGQESDLVGLDRDPVELFQEREILRMVHAMEPFDEPPRQHDPAFLAYIDNFIREYDPDVTPNHDL